MPRKKKEPSGKEKIDPDKVASTKAPPSLSSEKPIKSWYDIVSQEQNKDDSTKALAIQQWVESISRTPELLQAIQATLKPPVSELPSILGLPQPSGKISQPILKTEKGESSSSQTLSQIDLTPVATQSSSQIILSQSKIKSSEFLTKTTFQNILTIEDGFYNKNPFLAIQNHFPKNWFFKPWDLSKPQEYYQTILEFTGSAEFKHFYHKGSHDPSYSTCKILKIIHPKDWGQDLFKPKTFPINFQTKLDFCPTFSYWDYEQAWFNTFLIQNHYATHSWLFFLSDNANLPKFPAWFTRWWNNFGPIPDILPSDIRNGFDLFETHYKPSSLEKKFPFLCLYCSKFFVPWVSQWYLDYSSNNGIIVLQRKFKVKWWNSYRIPEKISKTAISEWLQKHGFLGSPPSQTNFLAQKSHASALLAAARTEEEYFKIMQQLVQSRTTSSATSSHSEESEPFIDLGNDNEDDCYGILSPIKPTG